MYIKHSCDNTRAQHSKLWETLQSASNPSHIIITNNNIAIIVSIHNNIINGIDSSYNKLFSSQTDIILQFVYFVVRGALNLKYRFERNYSIFSVVRQLRVVTCWQFRVFTTNPKYITSETDLVQTITNDDKCRPCPQCGDGVQQLVKYRSGTYLRLLTGYKP